MSKSKKAKAVKEPPNLDSKIERVQAKHTFTIDELVELGRTAGREQGEATGLEAALSSIKADYKSKIEGAEMRRDSAFRKQADGFEMCEVDGIIVYNTPKKGEKTIHFHLPNEKNPVGEIIRVEPMTPTDLQCEMALIEAANKPPEPGEPLNPVKDAFED